MKNFITLLAIFSSFTAFADQHPFAGFVGKYKSVKDPVAKEKRPGDCVEELMQISWIKIRPAHVTNMDRANGSIPLFEVELIRKDETPYFVYKIKAYGSELDGARSYATSKLSEDGDTVTYVQGNSYGRDKENPIEIKMTRKSSVVYSFTVGSDFGSERCKATYLMNKVD